MFLEKAKLIRLLARMTDRSDLAIANEQGIFYTVSVLSIQPPILTSTYVHTYSLLFYYVW